LICHTRGGGVGEEKCRMAIIMPKMTFLNSVVENKYRNNVVRMEKN
jgi:hypothetical protein